MNRQSGLVNSMGELLDRIVRGSRQSLPASLMSGAKSSAFLTGASDDAVAGEPTHKRSGPLSEEAEATEEIKAVMG